MEYVLKQILPNAVPAALEKADKYRELNQPAEADSICRDVLAAVPDHQLALRVLGLSLTDRFEPARGERFREAQAVFAQLADPYERAFYGALAYERQAKAQLCGDLPLPAVVALLEAALALYDEAEPLRPPGNDDAILRWNSCVRVLRTLVGDATEAEEAPDWESDFVPHRR